MDRHPLAVIAAEASLGEGVSVGPFAVLEGARVGSGSVLHAHSVVHQGVTLGARCEVHPFAVLGGAPQDRSYANERTTLVVGDDAHFREHSTVHRGTARGGGVTRVGSGVLVMCGAHIAHDCALGDAVVLSNGVQLAGHVVCEAHAVLGGLAAVAQYLRVGEGAFVAAGARVESDVPPYHVVQGDRARVRGLNTVGLLRRGASEALLRELTELHRRLYRRGLPLAVALGETTVPEGAPREVRHLLAFLRATLEAPRRRTRALEVPTLEGVAPAAGPAVEGGPRGPGGSRGGDEPT